MFGGNVQKLCSTAAAIASVEFNNHIVRDKGMPVIKLAPNYSEVDKESALQLVGEIAKGYVDGIVLPLRAEFTWSGFGNINSTFDARVFTIPDPVEVENYLIWRQKDCERNSVSLLAQKYYSHKQLQGANRTKQLDLIVEAGDNWNKWPAEFKRGMWGYQSSGEVPIVGYQIEPAPIFTSEDGRRKLTAAIPQRGY